MSACHDRIAAALATLALLAGVLIAAPAPAHADEALNFAFEYGAGAELWTPEARAAVQSAADTLASAFVVRQPVTVTVSVVGIDTPGATDIASSFVEFTGEGRAGFFPTVVQEKVLTGVDPNGPAPDARITWNFAEPWSFGDEVPADAYDFKAVLMHELLHTLGFLSAARQPIGDQRRWNTYDGFLRAADGTPVIDDAFAFQPEDDAALTGGAGGLFFAGPNAVAAYGGPVRLFTPDPWATASRSVSHVNGLAGYLMDPFFSYGPAVRTISPVEAAMLRDLGYTVR